MLPTDRLAQLDPRRSLRARIALIVGVSGLLFAFVLAVMVDRTAARQLDERIRMAAQREARLVGNSVSAVLKAQLRQARRLAASPALSDGMARARETREMQQLLEQARVQNPELLWLGVADAQGRLICTTGNLMEGEGLGDQPWFAQALRGPWVGVPSSSGVLAGRLAGDADGRPQELLELSEPVLDDQGRTIGLVIAALNWRWVREQHAAVIGGTGPGNGLETLLLAGNGAVVLGPADEPGRSLPLAELQALAATGSAAELAWGAAGLRLTAATPVRPAEAEADSADWLLVLRQDPVAARGGETALRERLLAFGLLASGAFAWLSWLLAGHFVRPVRRLAETAMQLQQGEAVRFDRVDPGPDDGLRLLAETLQRLDAGLREQMAAQQATARELDLHRLQLQQRVEARTQELSQAIAERSASDAFSRTMADHLPGLVAYWDADEALRFANRAFLDWFRLGPDQAIGRPMAELLGPGVWQRLQALPVRPLGEPMMPGAPEADLLLPDRAGPMHRFWTQRLADLQQGRTVGHYFFATDVTAVRLAEQRLQDLNRALRDSRDRAEAASQAKTAFLANMSHEIRTPLNAIVGMGYLIGQAPTAPENGARIRALNDAARHLLGVISDVLDLSKIESGRMTLDETEFDLGELIDRAITMVRGRAEAKGLALLVEDLVPERRWHGDAGRLSQALLNLLGNAVKFTDQGSVRLRCERVQAFTGGALLRFEVIDTGTRIDPATLARLFAPFVQGDASLTRRHGGTGLGLAITRQVARLMGGDAGALAGPQGNTFWLAVRLAVPRQRALPAPGPRRSVVDVERAVQALASRFGGARVLLVEDNAVNQIVAREVLELAQLSVTVACHGQEALEIIAREPCDLVLMDIQMPVMDGLEATRRIRAMPGRERLPILAMTANAFADERRACLQDGMDDHVSKPVDPATLYRLLLHWLSASAGALA